MKAELTQDLLTALKVELADEFDRNFARKAFFSRPWKPRRNADAKGSLLATSGHLRRSLRAAVQGEGVVFTSSLPYKLCRTRHKSCRMLHELRSVSYKKIHCCPVKK
jgi:phage gpG-like protein